MPELGRIMGLDVGDVRTGVALSDPLRILASPYRTVRMDDEQAAIDEIAAIASSEEVVRVVAGLPLDQHGACGPQAEKVLAFVERLQPHLTPKVDTMDERFSTVEAGRQLRAAGVRSKKQKQTIDQAAAVNILDAYMRRLVIQENRT